MAEFIAAVGLISGLMTIGEAGLKMSKSLYAIGESLVKAKSQIAELARELSHISAAFQSLAGVLESSGNILKPSLLENTQAVLADCKETYGEIEESVNLVRDRATKAKERAQWAFRKAKVKQLRTRLESAKVTLHLMVSILNLSVVLREQHEAPLSISHTDRQNVGNILRESEELAVDAQLAFDKAVDYEIGLIEDDKNRGYRRSLPGSHPSTGSQSMALTKLRSIKDGRLNIPEFQEMAIAQLESKDIRNSGECSRREDPSAQDRRRELRKFAPTVVRDLCSRWTKLFDASDEKLLGEASDLEQARRPKKTNSDPSKLPVSASRVRSANARFKDPIDMVWLVPHNHTASPEPFTGAIGLEFPSSTFNSPEMFDAILEKISELVPALSASESTSLVFAHQTLDELNSQRIEKGQFIKFHIVPGIPLNAAKYNRLKTTRTEDVWRIIASRAKLSGYPVMEEPCVPYAEHDEPGQEGQRMRYRITDVDGHMKFGLRKSTYGMILAKDATSLEEWHRNTMAKSWNVRRAGTEWPPMDGNVTGEPTPNETKGRSDEDILDNRQTFLKDYISSSKGPIIEVDRRPGSSRSGRTQSGYDTRDLHERESPPQYSTRVRTRTKSTHGTTANENHYKVIDPPDTIAIEPADAHRYHTSSPRPPRIEKELPSISACTPSTAASPRYPTPEPEEVHEAHPSTSSRPTSSRLFGAVHIPRRSQHQNLKRYTRPIYQRLAAQHAHVSLDMFDMPRISKPEISVMCMVAPRFTREDGRVIIKANR